MKILSIDTSSKICSVAVLEDNKLLKEIARDDGLTHSESLMPMIKALLNDINLSLKDIDLIVCDKGPGSFTGIRIGIATAKAFSDSLEIPTIGISSLEALAYNVKSDSVICSLIDAKNDNIYIGVFEKIGYNYILRRNFSAETISDVLKEFSHAEYNITFVGDGSLTYKDKILEVLPKSNFVENNDLSAFNLGLAGLNHYQDNDLSDVLPLYLRKPQAERMLELKENSKN